jgi:hypothetical protein
MVHELGKGLVSELGIGKNFPLGYYTSSWHGFLASGLPGIISGLTGIKYL